MQFYNNKNKEPEPLEKKSGAGAGATKKFAVSPPLCVVYLTNSPKGKGGDTKLYKPLHLQVEDSAFNELQLESERFGDATSGAQRDQSALKHVSGLDKFFVKRFIVFSRQNLFSC